MNTPTAQQKLAFADAVLNVLASRGPEFLEPFRNVLERVRARPRKRDVESIYRDFLEWSRGLSAVDRDAVSTELKRTVGLPVQFFDDQRHSRVAQIIQKKSVRTDDEWRVLEERVQELCELGGHESEIATINRLLARYKEAKRA